MCRSFVTNSSCPGCSNVFRRRRTSVPCWNGSLSPWRIHRHGLSCRSSRYDVGPDEVRTDELCSACAAASSRKRRSIVPMTTAVGPSYTYRHSYSYGSSSSGDSSRCSTSHGYPGPASTEPSAPGHPRYSIDSLASGITLVDAGVSRHACAANQARYSSAAPSRTNAWAGCGAVSVEGPRIRWCH